MAMLDVEWRQREEALISRVQLSPHNPDHYFALADLYYSVNDIERATAVMDRVPEVTADTAANAEAAYYIAWMLYQQGDLAGALAHADRVLEVKPGFMGKARLHHLYGNIHLQRRREVDPEDEAALSEATAHYVAILRQFPSYQQLGQVHQLLARCLLYTENWQGAIDHARRAQQLPAPPLSRAEALEHLGEAYLYGYQDFDAANQCFDAALQLAAGLPPSNENALVYLDLAQSFSDVRQYPESADFARRALDALSAERVGFRTSLQLRALWLLADTLFKQGQDVAALQHCLHALQLVPAVEGFNHHWLSYLHFMVADLQAEPPRNQWQKAISHFQQSLELAPDKSPALIYAKLGQCYYGLKDYRNAIHYLRLALDTPQGTQPPAYLTNYSLAHAEYALADHVSAARHFRKALELAPEDSPEREKMKKFLAECERKLRRR